MGFIRFHFPAWEFPLAALMGIQARRVSSIRPSDP